MENFFEQFLKKKKFEIFFVSFCVVWCCSQDTCVVPYWYDMTHLDSLIMFIHQLFTYLFNKFILISALELFRTSAPDSKRSCNKYTQSIWDTLIDLLPFLKLQKMEFGKNFSMKLNYFISRVFLGLDFFNLRRSKCENWKSSSQLISRIEIPIPQGWNLAFWVQTNFICCWKLV